MKVHEIIAALMDAPAGCEVTVIHDISDDERNYEITVVDDNAPNCMVLRIREND